MGTTGSQPIRVPSNASGSMLWKAAKEGNVPMVRALLNHEASATFINWIHNQQGTTPLMAASIAGKPKVVALLLEKGVDANAQDRTLGYTALHFAAAKNRVNIVDQLLGASCNPHIWTNDGLSALDLARMEHHRETTNAFCRVLVTAKGWLYMKKGHSAFTQWKKRWCMLYECSVDHSNMELAIYRNADDVKPAKVLFLTATDNAVSPRSQSRHRRKHTFEFTSTATFQRYQRETFSRSELVRTRRGIVVFSASGVRFATETEEGRDKWVELLGPLAFTPITALTLRQPQDEFQPVDNQLSEILPSAPPLEQDEIIVDNPTDCVICMDMPRTAVCVPCGHLAGCFKCLNELQKQRAACPICRTPLATVVRVYTC